MKSKSGLSDSGEDSNIEAISTDQPKPLDDLVRRFKFACRALIRERKVYGEDVQTLHDVLYTLEDRAIDDWNALMDLLCNAYDNLNDMPVSEEWAADWCYKAYPVIDAAIAKQKEEG